MNSSYIFIETYNAQDNAEQIISLLMLSIQAKLDRINQISYDYFHEKDECVTYHYELMRQAHSYRIVKYEAILEHKSMTEEELDNMFQTHEKVVNIYSVAFHINPVYNDNGELFFAGVQTLYTAEEAIKRVDREADRLLQSETRLYEQLREMNRKLEEQHKPPLASLYKTFSRLVDR